MRIGETHEMRIQSNVRRLNNFLGRLIEDSSRSSYRRKVAVETLEKLKPRRLAARTIIDQIISQINEMENK